MRTLLKKSIQHLKSKSEKIEVTNEYLKQLEYLNKVNKKWLIKLIKLIESGYKQEYN